MHYAELAPPPSLAPFVERLWTLEGDACELSGASQPVLPDGRPELVVHFGDAFERLDGHGTAERQGDLLFAGQLAGPLVLRPGGRAAVLGIRLRPYAAAALLDAPQCELAGAPVPVELLDRPLAQALLDLRDRGASPASAAGLVGEVLAPLFDAERLDRRVALAVEAITASGGRVAVSELARQAELTPRHLERGFAAQVGVGPKRLARITRFQRALAALADGGRAPGPAPGARTALSCGYADQAHLIRDFQELAGCSPGAWLRERAELTGFFVGTGEGPPGAG